MINRDNETSYEHTLLLRFSLIGLAITVMVAILLGFMLQKILVTDALDVVTSIASEHVSSGLQQVLAEKGLGEPLPPDTYGSIDKIVRHDLMHSGIVRIKIWSPGKTLLYSDDGRNIGTHSGANDELDEALQGKIGRELSSLDKSENKTERQMGKLLEVYVPIRVAGSDRILGAFEIYQTTDKLDNRISKIRSTIAIGVFGGFGLLYLALFGVVSGAARRLADRSKENHRLANELIIAYDQTIEGWAKALDLKDHETEGHSRRVTDFTVTIAKTMGLSGESLANIRRGALLHDIGKMGVPDAILLKQGPLSEEEWATMRQHPEYARKMLSSIGYLERAMDIPVYHHEKWDGSGYPRGLADEDIPLPARIFAIVDVWDALSSDRPYRKAWSRGKIIEHLRSLSGTHFDPSLLEVFLSSIGEHAQ